MLRELFEPVGCAVDLDAGTMTNQTGRYTKIFRDLEGLYADGNAFADMRLQWADRPVYDVAEFRPRDASGDLIFGVTRMVPGKVGDEFFMTRGHIHQNVGRPEVYYGQRGHGVMLLESPEGAVRTVPIGPMTACYVPPFWIHRSVNVGGEDLLMLFCYPADAGHDYAIIERSGGMRVRIVDDGRGGWSESANPAWTPRSAAALAALYRRSVPPAESRSALSPEGVMT